MSRCHYKAATGNDIADRVLAAYSRIYDHQTDVDEAFAEFQRRVLVHSAQPHGLRPPLRGYPRRVIQGCVAAVVVLAVGALSAVAVRPDSMVDRLSRGTVVGRPISSPAQFYSAGVVPVEKRQSPAAAGHKERKAIPKSIRRGMRVIDLTYRLIPGAVKLTAVIPASGRGRKPLCSWTLAAGHGPTKTFRASSSEARTVVVPLNGAQTVRIKSLPPHSTAASGQCAISQIQVESVPLSASVPATVSPIPSVTPVVPSPAEPTATITGSQAPAPQNTEANG